MSDPLVIVEKLLEYITDNPVTVHQIVCNTKLHNQTVRRYLQIIEKIQEAPKIKKEVVGIRILFRK